MLFRLGAICVALLISACGSTLLAQQPAAPPPPPADAATAATTQDAQQPALTPEQQREQQIRQFDPLDHSSSAQDTKAQEKAARDAEKRRNQDQPPTPGSLAAQEQDAARPAGPRVAEDDDTGDEPVQEYTGPAVLSRSYSVTRPLIPQQLKWTETLGLNFVYDTGVTKVVNADGTLSNASMVGTTITWGLAGRHYFRHDMIAVNYGGNYAQYSQAGFSGTNQNLAVDYSHVLTRRITLNVSGTGSILSQSYTLQNPDLGPNTTIANINLGTSPNIQVTDYGTKQFSTQASLTWQESTRLSFNGGISYFAVVRDAPGLLGMSGDQGSGDVNYRVTSKMTVGAYYSLSQYVYPHGYGTSHTDTFGAIYSYAFNRQTQLRLRGGISIIDSLGFQSVLINPVIAQLLGYGSELIDVTTKTTTSDISAQFIRDFRRGRTGTVAFAHGVSPGNGIFMTSEQESISVSFATPLGRAYTLTSGFGRDTLTAIGQALGDYKADYARIALSRRYHDGVSLNIGADIRHFDFSQYITVRNQLRFITGLIWGSQNGRIWPF